jgi:hypothetical protein
MLASLGVLRTSSATGIEKEHTVDIVELDPSGTRTGVVEVEKIENPLAEWKMQLTAEQFAVTRQAGFCRAVLFLRCPAPTPALSLLELGVRPALAANT